jgi:hypothetical protein
MNRFFRRMRRFRKESSARRSQGAMADQQRELFKAHTPQDVTSVRAGTARRPPTSGTSSRKLT